jgi:hypothetical protein
MAEKYEYIAIQRGGSLGVGWIVASIDGKNVSSQRILFYPYLNELGDKGWGLVGTMSPSALEYIFKRCKTVTT